MVVVFLDLLTDYEISSDSYKIVETEFFKTIHGKLVEDKEQDYDIGGNASEDGADADEGVEKFVKTYANCCGPEGTPHETNMIITTKKQLKTEIMAYVKRLMASEKFPEDKKKEFKELAMRKLTEEEIEEQAAKGDKNCKTALNKAIFDEFLANFSSETFVIVRAAEDVGIEGMIMGCRYTSEAYQVGDPVTLTIWKHGVREEAY